MAARTEPHGVEPNRVERLPRAVWRLNDGVILVQIVDVPKHVDLTGVAALIWVALDEPRTRDDLIAELAEFGADDQSVDEALSLLAAEGLVQRI